MSTNASITAKLSNGKWASFYVHYDGRLSYTGAILLAAYSTQERVDLLMDLGELSQVGPYVGCPEGHTFEHPVKGYCIAYHRDRGEVKNVSISDYAITALRNGPGTQQYNYLWDGSGWHNCTPGYLVSSTPLTIDQLGYDAELMYNSITQTKQE